MTRINKIVIQGFKSFAKHTELLFGPQYNCVLGPNGSGKSNVLDALCFVLGKSSSKSLRAEKSANLIYNGGKSKKPSKQGEVSIYFDNSNKKFPTDAKEIKITRIVKHSGQSVYKINDKTRTRQEILDLLHVARINPDAYNIILQGDIVKFVEMHPVARRQLIEEISGISVYEEKKHKALLELQKVDEKFKETEIVLTERNTYLRELKKDRDQALKYKDMNNKIKQNKASFLKIQLNKKEKEHKELKERVDKSDSELKFINEKIGRLKQVNDEKKKQIEEITAEIEEKGEVEQVNLNKEVETLKIQLTKIDSRIETCKNEINKIKQRKQDIKDTLSDTEQKISELTQEKKRLQEKTGNIQNERKEINSKLTEFRQKNKLDNIGDIEKSVEEIDKKSENLQKQIHELREEQHNLIREKDKISHETGTIDAKIKKVMDIESSHKKQVEELKNKRKEFKSSIIELNKLLDQDSNLALQLNNARKKIAASNEELAKLRVRDIGRREFTISDIAIKKILEQKNKKRGIYGTVADLGKVSSTYSLALEIAAGPRIKSIVVEDEKIAAELIKYLKQNKLGIATFLPLNKIKEKQLNKKITELADSKGSHGLALDLISYDKKFKNIFSYVFANTIVVDDIDVARRLGIGQAKFVTLEGDISELSGVMHGGFRAKRKGLGFKEKNFAKDIDEYEAIISNFKILIDKAEKKKIENEQAITELRDKKANLEGDIIKTEKSLHLDPSDIGASKQQKKELAEKETHTEAEIQKVSQKISNVNKELAEIKTEKQKLRAEISQLRNPTLLAELNTFEEKLSQINEDIIRMNSEIRNIDTQILNIYGPEKEKTRQIIKQLDKDKEEFKKEYNVLTKNIEEKQSILSKKEEEAKEFYAQFKGLFAKRSKVNEEITKNENNINQKLSESRNIEIKNNTFSLKNAGISAGLAALKEEFRQYEGVKLNTEKNEQQLKNDISRFEKLREQIGSVNMRALEIYEEVETQYKSLLEKKGRLTKEKEDVLVMMGEIEGKKKELFMKTFGIVNENFKKFFSVLSSKGDAYLVLEDPQNPFEAGLRINVKITGQKFLDIRSLSGGEKTMTALAFIFSIQEHEPASFYVLDEVDAALDKHNSEKFSKLIRKYSEKVQYIIISHNDSVISESDNLYGVSMDEHGMSKLVSLKI
ncbi:chromosome segregation protein SMC [Candidatus Woesearchaeota archaeon]|nr:chromosome segregation protein SMC [Candidatus Woesearchaeota archaeon]